MSVIVVLLACLIAAACLLLAQGRIAVRHVLLADRIINNGYSLLATEHQFFTAGAGSTDRFADIQATIDIGWQMRAEHARIARRFGSGRCLPDPPLRRFIG